MPREKGAATSRSPLRARIGLSLGAVFIGCTLVPILPAAADGPTLALRLDGRSVEPGASFSLPLVMTNTLGDSAVAIIGADVTAGSPHVQALGISPLPKNLDAGTKAAADVTGTAAPSSAGDEFTVRVTVSYTYEVPGECGAPSAPSASTLSSGSASPDSPEAAAVSPDGRTGGSGAPECAQTREGTAEVTAKVVVPEPEPPTATESPTQKEPSTPPSSPPASTPPPDNPTTPPAGEQVPPPRTSAPVTPPDAHSTPPGGPGSAAPPRSPSSRAPSTAGAPTSRRPAAPHRSVPTGSERSSLMPPLPTGTADLPSLAAPSEEYAELPLVTPDEDGGATTVAQESEAVERSITPAILLLFLVLLLLFSAPLAPVRRVRVKSAYVGRRRRN